ncbi:formate/nitrite transporter family protein [Corynebacterium sp. ES2794-CONJ1]|uniref:formate/nitrite transporter family protein n=1 Tax=unclassified Corynebacterium TaxID=2624378 RepID=UPI00216AAC90|nr:MULTISPECIES: formate/nitrite transporter family protein [unclassified Corynebacterium]MCS4489603.1 formate/nitrite transporter family protein [Corynebacterium sp. ES2775-CONJ]MCS4531513.1 formate/nitrite transporter family protein [Corynebacterium sp. ES2730-CONJ]MCU9518901.1 formate/nitrite transporter family protein [Corynebacterium sp. ES2794-CONJ1]
MTLNDVIDKSVAKKVLLLNHSPARLAVRAILAGVYLTLGTAFAAHMGDKVEALAPGLGGPVFAMLFFVGLAAIILLGAELTTSNMMYMCFGLYRRVISAKNATIILVLSTVFNLIGALIVGFLLSRSHVFAHMTDTHLAAEILSHKLDKDPVGWIIEGIVANFVVNMGIIGALLLKDYLAKFCMLLFVIAIFVGLGTEHVIANFSLTSIVGFASSPLPELFTSAQIGQNWLFAWIGNLIGGGVFMGLGYAWLNAGPDGYVDHIQ